MSQNHKVGDIWKRTKKKDHESCGLILDTGSLVGKDYDLGSIWEEGGRAEIGT